MREWDEMVARQVAADGVRTTWGEHMPAMTDDTRSILSAERHGEYLTALWSDDRAARQWARDRLRDHDAALRAALAAAEERAEQADQLAATLLVQRNAAESDADEARATLRITGELLDAAEAERDQAIRERDEAREKAVDERADAWRWAFKATDAEAQVAALTAERDEWKGAAEWVQALARQDQAQVRTLREALPPSHRLRLLADWVDRKHPLDSDSEIQDALRGWADAIAAEERAEQLSQQVAGLLSELRAAEGERDRWHASYEEEVEVRSCVERERDDLRAALPEYAHHNGSCRYSGMHWTPTMPGGDCTCGLDAALGEQEATPPEPCRKCGYVAGCMEPWEVGDGTLIDCGTCPSCRASAPQGEAEPWKWALDATEPAETRGS